MLFLFDRWWLMPRSLAIRIAVFVVWLPLVALYAAVMFLIDVWRDRPDAAD